MTQFRGRLFVGACLAVLASQVLPSAAFAEAAAADSTEVESLIVTARKREENIKDVPITVQSYGGEQLKEIGVNTIADIVAMTPGVELVSQAGQPATSDIIIRGGGSGRNINTDSATGIYVNGAFVAGGNIGGRTINAGDQFDLERIEVLKGPQGALYGRNALGGAINVISKRPSMSQMGGYLELRGGDYGEVGVEGAVDLPIIPDKFALRIAGQRVSQDKGFIYNPYLRNYADRGDQDVERVVARWTPTDAVEMIVQYDTFNVTTIGALNTPAFVADPYNYAHDTDARSEQHQKNLLGTLKWDFGWATLDVIGNVRHRTGQFNEDLDGGVASPGPFDATTQVACIPATAGRNPLPAPPNQRCTNFNSDDFDKQSLEGRLSGETGRFRWIVGADYFTADDLFTILQSGTAATAFRLVSTNKVDSWSAFGGLEVSLSDAIKLGVEGRTTSEDKTSSTKSVLTEAPSIPGTVTYDNHLDSSYQQPAFTVYGSYFLSPEITAYFRAGSGYRAGGLNIDARDIASPTTGVVAVVPDSYGPEKALAYEAGFKSLWFDKRIGVNVAAFQTDYKDVIQNTNNGLTGGSRVQYVTNTGKAWVRGVESELNFRGPLFGGRIGGYLTATWIDSEATTGLFKGLKLARISDWSASGLITYEHPLVGDIGLTSSLRYRQQWGGYVTPTNNADLQEPTIVDLTLGVKGPSWRLTGVVNNLLDEDDPINELSTGIIIPREPRTWSVRFLKEF